MKLQTDCREIMKRVNRITEDFQNMISTGLPVSSSTSTLPNDSNFLPQSQSRSSKFHKPEPPTVAELQFLEYQANKPTVTTLFIDHEKMGLEKQKVLNSLKEWFYFENNKYQNSSSSTSDSEEEYDIYQDSYITSLRDQTKDVASAARNIGAASELTNKKLSTSFAKMKSLYNKAQTQTSTSSSLAASRELKVQSTEFLSTISDLQTNLLAANEELSTERQEVKKQETKTNNANKKMTANAQRLETMVSELTKQMTTLEAENIALDTKVSERSKRALRKTWATSTTKLTHPSRLARSFRSSCL